MTQKYSTAGGSLLLASLALSAGDNSMAAEAQMSEAQSATETGASEQTTLTTITVVGTRIRGAGPVGSSVVVLDRKLIDDSGAVTTQDVVDALPQSFGGGLNETTAGISNDRNAGANAAFGSSPNLRGLGSDSTLVLIDGRRLAPGFEAVAADVSNIPLSAIERVEVLADGASAIYGSDAVGGVINFVLRKEYRGAESVAQYGSVTDGGLDETRFSQTFGNTWERGSALVSYEYYVRGALRAEDRALAREDLRPWGGTDFRSDRANPGNIVLDDLSFAIPAGQDGRSLTVDDLQPGMNRLDGRRLSDLYPTQRRHSLFATGSWQLTPAVELFATGRFGKRDTTVRQAPPDLNLLVPDTHPYYVDPFGGMPLVEVPYSFKELGLGVARSEIRSVGGLTGLRWNLGSDWRLESGVASSREKIRYRGNGVNEAAVNASLAQTDPVLAFNPFGDGSGNTAQVIDAIRGYQDIDQRTDYTTLDLKADGSLFRLPGGLAKLAVGAEYREEDFDYTQVSLLTTLTPERVTDARRRTVRAAFAEVQVPLVGADNRGAGIERLELSVAGRTERYSDFGSTSNPKYGLHWSPVAGINVRGTYGTSFKAPLFLDLTARRRQLFTFAPPDPASPTGTTLSIFTIGGNEDLEPERARTWTAGLDFTPAGAPTFTASLTYFATRVDDKIFDLASEIPTIYFNESQLTSQIDREPDPALVAEYFGNPLFQNFAGAAPEDIAAIVDARKHNLARVEFDGIDLNIGYGFALFGGDLSLDLAGTRFLDYAQALSTRSPFKEILDTVANPVDLRLRGSVSWRNESFMANLFVNYVDDYVNDETVPVRKIDAWTTVDLNLQYTFAPQSERSILSGLTLGLSAQNLLDEAPPFVNNAREIGFDPDNADHRGRFISLSVKKAWAGR